jgi:hypothetical protein
LFITCLPIGHFKVLHWFPEFFGIFPKPIVLQRLCSMIPVCPERGQSGSVRWLQSS